MWSSPSRDPGRPGHHRSRHQGGRITGADRARRGTREGSLWEDPMNLKGRLDRLERLLYDRQPSGTASIGLIDSIKLLEEHICGQGSGPILQMPGDETGRMERLEREFDALSCKAENTDVSKEIAA